jgi:hypothetical protein
MIKERAQGRGFSVLQMCDAFERNTVQVLFGPQYGFLVGGTRFDPSASLWATPLADPPPADAFDSGLPTVGPHLSTLPPGAATSGGLPAMAAVHPPLSDCGNTAASLGPAVGQKRVAEGMRPTGKRKRKQLDMMDAGDSACARAASPIGEEVEEIDLATMFKRCALCKCAHAFRLHVAGSYRDEFVAVLGLCSCSCGGCLAIAWWRSR